MVRRRGGWRGPEYDGDFPSLGWALLPWAEAMLIVPAGPKYGQPLVLDGWQIDALVRWYAINPLTGRFIYRRMVLELGKGTGKSPFLAAVTWMELVGPVLFDGWDADGEPVGKPWRTPWIQIAASAEDQTDNCWRHLLHMAGEDARLKAEYGVDAGETRVTLKDRPGRIEAVTSKSNTRTGQPITFAGLEETWKLLPGNGGPALARTIRANLTKSSGRSIEVTNAYEPGAGSVAEDSARMADKGREGILYISAEAPPVKDVRDPEQLRPALQVIYRDAPWVDIERVIEDCLDDDKPAIEVRREFLNQHVAPEARLARDEVLDEVLDVGAELEDGAPIAVGFDGSKTTDGTAIVGIHMVSGMAFLLGSWRRPPFADREWQVPRAQVMDTLRLVFDRYEVARMKMDPAYWADEMAQLQQSFGRDVVDRFPTSSPGIVTEAISAVQTSLEQAVRAERKMVSAGPDSYDQWGNQPLVDDLRAAQLVFTVFGSRTYSKLVKPEDGRKIDCAAALTYADQARREALSRGWEPKKKVEAPWVMFVD